MPGFRPLGSAPLGSTGALDPIVHLTESVAVGLSTSALHISLLRARLAVAAEPATTLDGISVLTEQIALEDGLALVFRETLLASLAVGDTSTLSYTAIARMVDALLLSGSVTTAADAHDVILEALALGAMAEGTPLSSMTDALSVASSAASYYQAVLKLVDALALADTQTSTATLAIAVQDSVAVGEATTHTLDALDVLRERIDFVLQVAIDDQQYVAWSMNTTSKGATKYTNYPFNSFMRIGGRWYGVSDTGRYRLEGDDDNGSPITAKLRLGMSSLGTRLVKHVSAAYLGYSATGDMRLKVIVANETTGAREAHVYRLHANGADSVREGRVPIGRGLKSVYWDFQIENVDGADFDIDVVEIYPLYLERRVRGNAGGSA